MDPMDITRFDIALYLFAYGMVISGAYIVDFYNLSDRIVIMAVSAVAALVWMVYLRWWVRSRLDRFKEFVEPEDEEEDESPA